MVQDVGVKASGNLVEKRQLETADDKCTPRFLEDASRHVVGSRLRGTRAARVAGRGISRRYDRRPHSESRSGGSQPFSPRPSSWVLVAPGGCIEGDRLVVASTAAMEDHFWEASCGAERREAADDEVRRRMSRPILPLWR